MLGPGHPSLTTFCFPPSAREREKFIFIYCIVCVCGCVGVGVGGCVCVCRKEQGFLRNNSKILINVFSMNYFFIYKP